MATLIEPAFRIDQFLSNERKKDLLRFSTAGSVDDGKSTLIGRLLYDTQSVYEDQVRSIQGKGTTAPGQIDFALLTDGLRAEREQGITIDVAYRYFSTAHRKFIIADTPGHEQYTRNMATGASTADATVVLLDASKGVLLQSRRHAYIASLLRVKHVVVAVNKMDLIGYDEAAFVAIREDFTHVLDLIAQDIGNPFEATFIPVSALVGDNIVHRTHAMPWYDGPSLLEVLERLPSSQIVNDAPFRFPVQRVLRPDHSFRGFAGQIASGTVRVGDAITVLPSGKTANVARIVTWDGDLGEAHAPLSVTLTLDREVDISRGDLISSVKSQASVIKSFTAALVWMDQRPLDLSRRYLLKHTSHTVPAIIASLAYRTDIGTLRRDAVETLEMNGIAVAQIQLLRPIAVDAYNANRSTGACILIDPETNSTVAACMIKEIPYSMDRKGSNESQPIARKTPISAEERSARWGHRGASLELTGPVALLNQIECAFFTAGLICARIDSNHTLRQDHATLHRIVEWQIANGILVLITNETSTSSLEAVVAGEHLVLSLSNAGDEAINAAETAQSIEAVFDLIARTGILHRKEKSIVL